MDKAIGDLTMNQTDLSVYHAQPQIHAPSIFQIIVRRERRRADRDGSTFALAVFAATPAPNQNGGIQEIAGIIQEKMRAIDEIGWLAPEKLGVLLPATDREGGRMFSRRVLEAVSAASSVFCDVHVYPSGGMSDRGGDDDSEKASGPESPGASYDGGAAAGVMGEVFSREIPRWKRSMDLFGSAVLIILLSPVFLLMSLYIKAVSPGRVIFRQERVGYRGKRFTFLKFRTMRENNDADAHRQHLKELIREGKPMEKLDAGKDPRIIPGGRIIRKASLDELPQLFNVLRGEMSLVGPRPCIPYEAEEYRRWHTHRFDVLPGMTGLWQVSGKNRLSFEQMIRLDIAYTDRMSFLIDLKILILTMPTVLGLVFTAGLGKVQRKLENHAGSFTAKNRKRRPLIHA
jgi:lipopolysaccharide/colanic/teichoic acid biosynthesis glycosyltransferase